MLSELRAALATTYSNALDSNTDQAPSTSLMKGFPPAVAQRVTGQNFMASPYNRWAFRNMARIRPTITVACGTSTPSVFGEERADLNEVQFESASGHKVRVIDHLKASSTDGFLVIKNGAIVSEQYFDGHSADQRHIMFSVTKSLVGIAAEQSLLDITLDAEALASHYVPELQGSAFGQATVRQLLDMAVGIDYVEAYDDPNSGSSQYGYACGLMMPPANVQAHPSLYQFLPSLKQAGTHGGFFHYVTATTEVLAWVMERASGTSCAQALQCIWASLGCERDAYFIADPWGRSVAGAGFNATLRDMGRFGQLLLSKGCHNGEQLIAAAAIESVLKGSDPDIYAKNEVFSLWTPGASYKSQWYVYNDEALMAAGIHGQMLYVDFVNNTVIVKQSSLPDAVTLLDLDTVRMVKALAREI